jgi:uncharacterized phage protein (TIGR02218 family)
MKTASAGLKLLLATYKNLYVADLFTITLKTGLVLRYTSADQAITFGGNTFVHNDAQVSRGTITVSIGTEVPTMDLMIIAAITHLVNGVPILQAIRRGDLQAADVRVETVYMPTWGDTSVGSEIKFIGSISSLTNLAGTKAEFICKGKTELLNVQSPITLIQPPCPHTLFDSNCGVVRASFEDALTVAAGTTVNQINSSVSARATGFYDLGVLRFTSGALNGRRFHVKQYTNPTTILLFAPLPFVPTLGDAFSITAGCDKLQTTCNTKFANLARFGGFPYVPKPETAL